MAESFIYDLCKAVGSKVLEEGRLLYGVREEAEKMEKKLKRIEAVLREAEKREMEADVKEWIRELKDVAYYIEDVLDDWSIAQMQDQFGTSSSQHGNNTNKPEAKDQVCFTCIPTPNFCFKQTKSRHDIARTIIAINSRLDEIYEGKKRFKFQKTDTSSINAVPTREITTAYEEFTALQSQEEDRDELVKKLMHGDFESSAADRIPIISIVGMGGIGKTTLARLVYDDETVKSHFSKSIWVCVSNTFNELNVIKAIALGFRVELPNGFEPRFALNEIENSIVGLKFLIVLDDVWKDSEGKWGAILKCLAKGDTQGSRILMTTRNSDFSQKMRAVFALPVGELSETNAWSLFRYYAFPEDSKLHEEVEDIAQKLVKKCDGLPLALQVLGRHMATKTTRSEWHDVLASKIWETSFKEKVFNSLAFNYLELQSEAKRCFAFCSVFPKDTVMGKNELIHLWMAQSYLQERKDYQMEVLGEECFDSLLRLSFLKVTTTPSYRDQRDTYVTMHGIVHDFAQFISNGEVATLDALEMHEGGDSTKLRHLTFRRITTESNYLHSSFDLKALRSLSLTTTSATLLKELCSYTPYIRALHIKLSSNGDTLDETSIKYIGKLVHLRLVRLSSSFFTVLPEEICSLPYLQTLDLKDCGELKSLPKEIGRLTCLRHILFRDDSIDSLPKGLGKLSYLQTLSYFPCSSVVSKDCCSLEDLRDLNNLRGHLLLKNLNKVAQVGEAIKAQLHMKKHIGQLTLEFGEGDPSLQSDVLEALEPAKENYIELLKIKGHSGQRCPRWIGGLRNMKEVVLENVGMEVLPARLGMLCYLEKLYIKGAHGVKHVGVEFFGISEQNIGFFPKLMKLEFINMPQWEYWECPEEIPRSRITIMPSLRRLTLWNCGIRSLPRFLEYAPLEILEAHCRLLPVVSTEDGSAKRWRIGDIVLPQNLKEIKISWVESEKEAPVNQPAEESKEVRQKRMYFHLSEMDSLLYWRNYSIPRWMIDDWTYLRDITFSHVTDECLPPLGLMPSLEKLSILFANKVEKVGNEFLGIPNSTNDEANKGRAGGGESATSILFPRLKKLHFAWMARWEEWEDPAHQNNLIIMPSLCHLKIDECKKLKCLPHFFKGVEYLKKLEVDAGPEGSMPKIQNSSTSYANNEPARQTDITEISVSRIRHGWVLDWFMYCAGLRELRLDNCDAASFGALEVLPSLEVLRICYSRQVRHLGKEVILISSLKELYLSYLGNLEEWEVPSPPQLESSSSNESTELSPHGNENNSTVITSMPHLRILSILYCPKLKALPDFLRSVPLESLSIKDCWALEAWCVFEAGEDWRNWISNIPQVNFKFKFEAIHCGSFSMPNLHVEVPELKENNYKVWKERILQKLTNSGLYYAIENPQLTIIDDSIKEEIATHERWMKANHLSCVYIKTKMSPFTRRSVDHHHDVNDLLKAIDEQFIDSYKAFTSTSIMEFLSMKLTTVKGVREHIMKMMDLAAQLKALEVVDMPEAFLVYFILNSLPKEYISFKDTYHTQRDIWSMNELITMCVQEEERLLMDHVKECDDDY